MCEDYPCCGHESGCCPDFDENGNQLNMICVCGAEVPLNSRYSLCQGCLRGGMDGDYPDNEDDDWEDEDYEDEVSDRDFWD